MALGLQAEYSSPPIWRTHRYQSTRPAGPGRAESAGFDPIGYQHAGDERLRGLRAAEIRRPAVPHPRDFPQRFG